jgi:hypothetical protein
MELSSSELGNLIDEKDKEIAEAIRLKEEIRQEQLNLRRKKIELDSSHSKAQYNYEKLKIERSLLSSRFWAARHSGL